MSTFKEVSSVKEKYVAAPDKPIADRAFIRYDCDNQSFADGEFNQLRFKVDAPSTRSIFRNTRIVLPMSFKFKTRKGKSVFRAGIAPKSQALDRIFRSVEININGQSYMQSPLEKLVHRYVSSSTSLKFEPDGGSMLPVLPKDDVAIPYHNYSFEQRCKEFAQSWNASTQSYEFDLEIFLDGGPLSAFIRGQQANGNLAVPYCFNMDITVQFDQSYGKTDTQAVQGNLGQSCWKHCFDIQQPCTKLAVEREGFKPREPHLKCRDVARYLVLDEGRETRVIVNATRPKPQPGHSCEQAQNAANIHVVPEPRVEALPGANGNTMITILGQGLYERVIAWLEEKAPLPINDTTTDLLAAANNIGAVANRRSRYYLGWFRIGASTLGGHSQGREDAFRKSNEALFLDSQERTIANATRQVRGPSSFMATLDHGGNLGLKQVTELRKVVAPFAGTDFVRDHDAIRVVLASAPTAAPGTALFGEANLLDGGNAYRKENMHPAGYRWVLMEVPVAPAVGSNMTLVARGLSAHEDRGPEYEQRVTTYDNANTAAVLLRYNKPFREKFGMTSLRIFETNNDTLPLFGEREPRLDSAGNYVPGTLSLARKRTNIGTSSDMWRTWYFSDSELRYQDAVGGNIKLNGLLEKREEGTHQNFMIWADKSEQSALDDEDEIIVIAQAPVQQVRAAATHGGAPSLTDVNINGIYKPERAPFGFICPYSNATQGLEGKYLDGRANGVSVVKDSAAVPQEDFRCGDVTLIPYREPEPIVAIDAKYQSGRRPHVACEVVLHENMKRQYMLDDYRMERHRFPEATTIEELIDGKRIFFSDLRINEVPNCIYVLACVDPEQLDLEFCTSGLSDCLLSTLKTRVQVNNTIAFDFTDKAQEYSTYEMFARACPQSNISYQCFKDRRPILAFKPEELAVDEFQAGRFQISNLNLETVLELSPSWKRILQRAGTAKSHLATSPDQGSDYWKSYQATNKLLPYLKELPVRVELVVEYSNYMLQVDDTGKTTRVLNRLPAMGESGFEFRNPRPAVQTLSTPSFVELGM